MMIVVAIISVVSIAIVMLMTALFNSSIITGQMLTQQSDIQTTEAYLSAHLTTTSPGSVGLALSDGGNIEIMPTSISGDQFVFTDMDKDYCYRVFYLPATKQIRAAVGPTDSKAASLPTPPATWSDEGGGCTSVAPGWVSSSDAVATCGPSEYGTPACAADPILDSSADLNSKSFVLANNVKLVQSVTTTGTLPNKGNVITGVADTSGFKVGSYIGGSGIQPGTTVTAVSGSSITLSQVTTTAGGSGTTIYTGCSGPPNTQGGFQAPEPTCSPFLYYSKPTSRNPQNNVSPITFYNKLGSASEDPNKTGNGIAGPMITSLSTALRSDDAWFGNNASDLNSINAVGIDVNLGGVVTQGGAAPPDKLFAFTFRIGQVSDGSISATVSDQTYKAARLVATTPLTGTYNNGVIKGNSAGKLTVDGVSPDNGDNVLVTGQNNKVSSAQNGLYKVENTGRDTIPPVTTPDALSNLASNGNQLDSMIAAAPTAPSSNWSTNYWSSFRGQYTPSGWQAPATDLIVSIPKALEGMPVTDDLQRGAYQGYGDGVSPSAGSASGKWSLPGNYGQGLIGGTYANASRLGFGGNHALYWYGAYWNAQQFSAGASAIPGDAAQVTLTSQAEKTIAGTQNGLIGVLLNTNANTTNALTGYYLQAQRNTTDDNTYTLNMYKCTAGCNILMGTAQVTLNASPGNQSSLALVLRNNGSLPVVSAWLGTNGQNWSQVIIDGDPSPYLSGFAGIQTNGYAGTIDNFKANGLGTQNWNSQMNNLPLLDNLQRDDHTNFSSVGPNAGKWSLFEQASGTTSKGGTYDDPPVTPTYQEVTPTQLSGLPVTDPLNSTTVNASWQPLTSGTAWQGPQNPDGAVTLTKYNSKGTFNASGWHPVGYGTVAGAWWNQQLSSSSSGGGTDSAIVTEATYNKASDILDRYVGLWADMPNPGDPSQTTAQQGYQLVWVDTSSTSAWQLQLVKWVNGTPTVLAQNNSFSFSANTTFALVTNAGTGTVSAWTNSGSGFTKQLSANDNTFSGGYSGIEGSGSNPSVTNFIAGTVPIGSNNYDTATALETMPVSDDLQRNDNTNFSSVGPTASYWGTPTNYGLNYRGGAWNGSSGGVTSDIPGALASMQMTDALQPTCGNTNCALSSNWSLSNYGNGETIGSVWGGSYLGYGGTGMFGAYWNAQKITDSGSGDAAQVTLTNAIANGQSFGLWLNMPNAPAGASTVSGYDFSMAGTATPGLYTVQLIKEVNGASTTVYSANINLTASHTAGSTIALVHTPGQVSVYIGTAGANFSLLTSWADTGTNLTSGYAGLHGNGGSMTVDNFKAGALPGGSGAVSASDLAGAAVTDPLNSSTKNANWANLTSGSTWQGPSPIPSGGPQLTTYSGAGNFTASGWWPSSYGAGVTGDYWKQPLTTAGGSMVSMITYNRASDISDRYVSLWAGMPNPGGAQTTAEQGYQLVWIDTTSTSVWQLRLIKWVNGTPTILAQNNNVSFPANTTFALVVDKNAGTVSGWMNSGSGFAQIPNVTANDTTYQSGYAGIEGSGSDPTLTNFTAASLTTGGPTRVGWGSANSSYAATYWSVPNLSYTGGQGTAVQYTLTGAPAVGTAVDSFLNMPSPVSGSLTGYVSQIKRNNATDDTYTLSIYKYSNGAATLLAQNPSVPLTASTTDGSTVAMVQQGNQISLWVGTAGADYSQVVSTTDASPYTSGYTGLQVLGNSGTVDNFVSGNLPSGPRLGYGTAGGPSGAAYWNQQTFSEGGTTGPGDAAEMTLTSPTYASSLWLNATSTASTLTGYRLLIANAGGGGEYTWELIRYDGPTASQIAVLGYGTVHLTASQGADASTIGLMQKGGTVNVWVGTNGQNFLPLFVVADNTYTSGYAGLDATGTTGSVDNFSAGQLSPMTNPSDAIYWNKQSFTQDSSNSGFATIATITPASPQVGYGASIWAGMQNPVTEQSGYQARLVNTSAGVYTLQLNKWVSGHMTTLATKTGLSVPAGTIMAILVEPSATGGQQVSVWTVNAGVFTKILSASDATYSSGFAGVEADTAAIYLTNFAAGPITTAPEIPGVPWELDRAPGANADDDWNPGDIVTVSDGALYSGSIWQLTTPQSGAITLEQTPLNFSIQTNTKAAPGTIMPFAGNGTNAPSYTQEGTPPTGYLWADGTAYNASSYPDLFAAIGTTYGGSCPSGNPNSSPCWFQVPDIRGRTPIGADPTYNHLGLTAGTQQIQLSTNNLPPLQFSASGSAGTHNIDNTTWSVFWNGQISTGCQWAACYSAGILEGSYQSPFDIAGSGSGSGWGSGATNVIGSGAVINVMNPYLIVNWLIKK